MAVLVHNAEEAIALAIYPSAPTDLANATGFSIAIPSPGRIYAGLALFTFIPALVLLRARRNAAPGLVFMSCVIATMMAANAVVPHLAGALWMQSYQPGLVTALAFSLPAGVVFLHTARRAQWLSPGRWRAAVGLGAMLLPLVLFGFWALGELIAEIGG
nr:HXXEE domain-containing protein [Erythrobacter ani]